MAPLTWRNVDAPDLSAAANMQARSTQGIVDAFKTGGNIGRGIYGDQVNIGSAQALQEAAKFTSSADWTAALKNGTAYGNLDPRFISAQATQQLDGKRHDLLQEERAAAAEARAQEAHAASMAAASARLSGGGSGGGGGGGRGRGGGGSGRSNKDGDADRLWKQKEADARIADANGDTAGAKKLREEARVIAQLSKRDNAALDTADNLVKSITAEKEATKAATETRVNEALNAANGADGKFSAYSVDYSGALGTPAPDPAMDAFTSTMSMGAASPVAGLPGGGTRKEVAGGAAMVTPPNAVPSGSAPVAQDRPQLSFGSAVDPAARPQWMRQIDSQGAANQTVLDQRAAAETAQAQGSQGPLPAKGRETSWSNYAKDVFAGDANVVSQSPSQERLDAAGVPVGLPADMPEVKAFTAAHEAWKADQQTAAQHALEEETRTDIKPEAVQMALASTRGAISGALSSDPNMVFFDNKSRMKALDANGDTTGITDAVIKDLAMPKNTDVADLQNQISDLAASSNTDFATAAAAMVASRKYEKNAAFDWSSGENPFNIFDAPWGVRYYDRKKAEGILEAAGKSGAEAQMRERSTAVSNMFQRVTMAENNFQKAGMDFTKAQAEFGADSPQAIAARAKVLAADKEVMKLNKEIPKQLRESGIDQTRADAPKNNEEPKPSDFINPAAVARYQASMATNGTPNPVGSDWSNGQLRPQSTPDSTNGKRLLDTMTQPASFNALMSKDTMNKKTFLEWAQSSPAAREQVFGAIQEQDFKGNGYNLPPDVAAQYEEYKKSNIPQAAIEAFTALGIDLSKDRNVAVKVANDPQVQDAINKWKESDHWYRSPRIKEALQKKAADTIKLAASDARNAGTVRGAYITSAGEVDTLARPQGRPQPDRRFSN